MPPTAGHGSLVYFEKDPAGSPGTFTVCPGLNYDMNYGWTRGAENVTPHNTEQADEWVRDETITRNEFPMTLNFVPTDTEHIKLLEHAIGNVTFGMKIIGPSTIEATDSVIWSGGLTNWEWQNPVRSGGRKVTCVFRPSGPWKINNTLYS